MSAQAAAAAAAPRFHKISSGGLLLPVSATEWEGVYVPALSLLVSADVLACGALPFKQANAAAAKAMLCGRQVERAPSKSEYVNYLFDDWLFEPALDPVYFRNAGKWSCEWTSTECAPAGCAWYVYVGAGDASRLHQSGHARVRGVVSGQSWDLGKEAA
jgi:hypothetical protein